MVALPAKLEGWADVKLAWATTGETLTQTTRIKN